MSRLSPYAKLTSAMEADGCYLVAADDGQVRINAHAGDEAALEKWDVDEIRGYIDRNLQPLWRWLRTPLDDLTSSDRAALYGRLGARGRLGGGRR